MSSPLTTPDLALACGVLAAYVTLSLVRVAHALAGHRQARDASASAAPAAASAPQRTEGLAPRVLRFVLLISQMVLITLFGFWAVFGLFQPLALAQMPLPFALRAVALAGAFGAILWLHLIHRALGQWFSVQLRLSADHALITHGPYARVRHPMYGSFFAFFLCTGIASGNGAILLNGVLLIVSLALRVPAEEAMLRARFGAEYDAYCARTTRFFPGLPL